MPMLNLWIQMVGTQPTQWYESTIELKGGTFFTLRTEERSVEKNNGLFRQRLAERVWQLFETTRRAGETPFDSVGAASNADRGSVNERDLVCYVCDNKLRSIIRRFDVDAFNASLQKARGDHLNGSVQGMTHAFAHGICSEIYLQDNAYNITACANCIYHEWMHNKTNWKHNEDPNWVHKRGGGGLAQAQGGELTGLTPETARIMCGRLWVPNRQFLDGLT
jgi:hypothetical protein